MGQKGFLRLNPYAFCYVSNAANPCPNPVASSGFGNTTRNEFRGIPSYQVDPQVSRIFPIHESLNLYLRLEAFNVLNHPNFSNPGASNPATPSTFGYITGASAARVFQGGDQAELLNPPPSNRTTKPRVSHLRRGASLLLMPIGRHRDTVGQNYPRRSGLCCAVLPMSSPNSVFAQANHALVKRDESFRL